MFQLACNQIILTCHQASFIAAKAALTFGCGPMDSYFVEHLAYQEFYKRFGHPLDGVIDLDYVAIECPEPFEPIVDLSSGFQIVTL